MKILPHYYYLALFLGSFLFSLVLTPLVRRLAVATGQVAVPKDSRWHKKETALMGGAAIFISTMTVWILAVNFIDWPIFGPPYLPMVLCASGIFAMGLADDIFNMDPQHKLAAQIVITSILMLLDRKSVV